MRYSNMLGIYCPYTNTLFTILIYVFIGLHKMTLYSELLSQPSSYKKILVCATAFAQRNRDP